MTGEILPPNSNTTAVPEQALRCSLPLKMALAMFVINIIFSVIGTIGNLLVCASVFSTPSLRRISNYFISNLAVADLFITMSDQPLLAAMLWGKMNNMCFPKVELAFRVIGNVSCAASLLTLCFISIDRCVAITKPFRYSAIITNVKFGIMLAVAWIFPAVSTYLRIEVSKKITSYLTVCLFGTGYTVLAACYVLIFVKIVKQSRKRRHLSGLNRERQAHMAHKTEKKLATTIALIIAVFTVAWTPLFYLRVKTPDKNYGILYYWARTIALSSSAINPALYCFRNEEYRKAFKRILRNLFCSCCRCGADANLQKARPQLKQKVFTNLPGSSLSSPVCL